MARKEDSRAGSMNFVSRCCVNCRKLARPQIGERGVELRVLRDDLLEQRNRGFERVRSIVVGQ